ncbi:molecular chaperone [Mycoplasmopsis californica]|nr:molecular chaperone [Mycoplasmopsis californica]
MLFADTAGKDLYIGIFKNNKLHARIYVCDLVKKIEPMIFKFRQLLKEKNIKLEQIDSFYINIGPGSFTGSRSALILFKTIASVLKKDIYIGNTFDILKVLKTDNDIFLEASKTQLFVWNRDTNKVSLVDKASNLITSTIDYELLEKILN